MPQLLLKQPHKVWDYESIIDSSLEPRFRSEFGVLYKEDCLKVLSIIQNDSIDTVFADPPFNLGKIYGEKVDDSKNESDYLSWCEAWLSQCVRILKPGGSLFLYNIPKWNILLGAHLYKLKMDFRHWIAVDVRLSLPIPGRLYPAHYSLLYYSKGKPNYFHKIRTPIKLCRHCGKELKDYGGHRHAMNPRGVNLTDIWDDIPPVRHRKYKSSFRTANQLSTTLVRRAIEMSTSENCIVVDPFGGAGTTFDVCESLKRNWIGIEIEEDNCKIIETRIITDEVKQHSFTDYVEHKTTP